MVPSSFVALIVILMLVQNSAIVAPKNETIWLGTFFPSGMELFDCYLAVLIAVEDVNNDETLLPHHRIEIMMNDSQCNPKAAINGALWQQNRHPLTGIIGAACSIESIPIALVGSFYHIPQISYSSTSPELSNKGLYPYFSRVVPSDVFQAHAWVEILKFYGWTQFATINSQESIHSLVTENFLRFTTNSSYGFKVLTSESFAGSVNAPIDLQLSNIKKKGATIIFLACYEADAIRIINKAAKMGLVGPSYVWIGTNSWLTSVFIDGIDDPNYAIGMMGPDQQQGSSSLNIQFHEKYYNRTSRKRGTYSFFTETAYDALLLMAKALHQVIEIEQLRYDASSPSLQFSNRLLSAIREEKFVGVSAGTVALNTNGDRLAPYAILNIALTTIGNITEVERVTVAYWDPVGGNYTELQKPTWADGTNNIPLDHILKRRHQINKALKFVIAILAVLGIVNCIGSLFLVWHWRQKPRIRAASSVFLGIILLASMVAYCTILVLSVEPVSTVTCILPLWLGHLAFFVAFGSLFAKTFRVWQIFDSAMRLKKKHIKLSDSRLLLFVLIFTLVGVLFLILITALEPFYPQTRTDDSDPSLEYFVCSNSSTTILWFLYTVEILSLFFGVFLSFKTRKIELLKFNESTQIAISIYTLLFIGLIFIPLAIFFRDSLLPDISYIIQTSGILVGTTTLIVVLLIPKFRATLAGKPDEGTSNTSKNTVT